MEDGMPELSSTRHVLNVSSGDESALKQWRAWREHSIEKYKEEYARLNVTFDVYLGESMVSKEYMNGAISRLEDMGLVSESDHGAKVIDLEKYKLGKAVVRKKGKL
jgi:arginyl-tRNA synthetase